MNLNHLHHPSGTPLEPQWFDLDAYMPDRTGEGVGAETPEDEREEWGDYAELMFDD